MTAGSLFLGPAGHLGAEAVQVALRAGLGGNASLLFGRIVSLNGKPFWELRRHLCDIFHVSTRTITRYFRALSDAGLIVNKPAPLDVVHPGTSKSLPYRPWYKWAIGLPQLRDSVRQGSKEAYQRWQDSFEKARTERVTRSKLGAILGSIVSSRTATPPRPKAPEPPRKAWTVDEIDEAMRAQDPSYQTHAEWTASRSPPD